MASTDPLIAAERSFASTAANQGTRTAFLQFLADESILFRPDPVQGRAWFQGQPDSPGLLSWRPEFAEMAASGDLGYTTGPWNFRADTDGEPVQFGQYVSVWRRVRRATWEVVLDVGVTCPPPVDASQSTQLISIVHALERQGVSDSDLLKAEAAFAGQVHAQGYLAAVQHMAAANVWVLRMGQPPVRGLLDLRETLSAQQLSIEWKVAGAVAATSGDLGYVYGTGRRVHTHHSEQCCSFLRIWRWGDQERWELALEIDNPHQSGT